MKAHHSSNPKCSALWCPVRDGKTKARIFGVVWWTPGQGSCWICNHSCACSYWQSVEGKKPNIYFIETNWWYLHQTNRDVSEAMKMAFIKTDKLFNDRARRGAIKCGTTALGVMIDLSTGVVTTAGVGNVSLSTLKSQLTRKQQQGTAKPFSVVDITRKV